MALITDLPSTSSVASADLFVKDTGTVTQKIAASDLAAALGGGLGLLSSNPDLIYNGGKATTGNITLSSSLQNYKWILIRYITNTNYCTEFVPIAVFSTTSSSVIKCVFAGNWVAANNSYQYVTNCTVSKVDNTHLSVSTTTNDANFILGVVEVYGFK